MSAANSFWATLNRVSLVKQIIIGLLLGTLVGYLGSGSSPLVSAQTVAGIGILGNMFVGALKAIAPVLVFVLVAAAVAQHQTGSEARVKPIVILYVIGTFAAATAGVAASFLFPTNIALAHTAAGDNAPPSGIAEVLQTLLMNLVANPVTALSSGNYIGILFWALLLGFALRHAAESTGLMMIDMGDAVSKIVGWVIRFAPLGIFGIVTTTVAATGLEGLASYAKLLLVLVGSMLFIALVLNPLIVWWKLRRNPYPLVLTCLRESGVTAFFTRSSAANIPVNMMLCKKLGLHEDTYSISIPLGATINMAGAAITISVLSLAAAHTQNIQVDFTTALLLSLLATVSACGASGVAGGSLLLIPLACNLLGISNDVAMQVVAVGFTIGVVQDSCETALNSSTDVLFTAAAELGERRQS